MIKSLKGRISLVYLTLVIISSIVGFISVVNLFKLSGSIEKLMTANYKSISAVNNMIESIENQDRAILIYIDMDKQKGLDEFSQNNNSFVQWFNIEKNNITEFGEKKSVEKTNFYYTKYTRSFLQLQEIRNTLGIENAIEYYNKTITPYFNNTKKSLRTLKQLNEKAMFKGKNNTNNDAKRSIYIVLILTSLATTGGFIISRYFTNLFLKPIYTLTETVKLVKAGDMNQQTTIISKDEIGELAVEFNHMTKRLQQFEKSALGNLMSEKNRFIAVVKNISDPLIVMDNNYKIAILNKSGETFFNISEEKSLNKHFLEVIRNGELFDHISAEFNPGEDRKEKIIHMTSNDEDYYLNVVVTTVKDVENNLTGLIVLFQNVTALKEFEKTRTNFIATISHEFKTPLTSIMMGIDLLLNTEMGVLNDDQMNITTVLKEDCEILSTLVSDIMELTKIESGKAIFTIQACSISGIIENTYKQFKQIADQKSIDLEFDAEENLPLVSADFEKITWVVNNLVSNALKYTNAGDDIMISASVKNNMMYVSIRDTGIGILDEYKENIFNKFFQVKGNDLEIRGTGLGLSIAKEIIEVHGGKIWCESKLDLGSTFIFTLSLSK